MKANNLLLLSLAVLLFSCNSYYSMEDFYSIRPGMIIKKCAIFFINYQDRILYGTDIEEGEDADAG